jgi:hypothetical protein
MPSKECERPVSGPGEGTSFKRGRPCERRPGARPRRGSLGASAGLGAVLQDEASGFMASSLPLRARRRPVGAGPGQYVGRGAPLCPLGPRVCLLVLVKCSLCSKRPCWKLGAGVPGLRVGAFARSLMKEDEAALCRKVQGRGGSREQTPGALSFVRPYWQPVLALHFLRALRMPPPGPARSSDSGRASLYCSGKLPAS